MNNSTDTLTIMTESQEEYSIKPIPRIEGFAERLQESITNEQKNLNSIKEKNNQLNGCKTVVAFLRRLQEVTNAVLSSPSTCNLNQNQSETLGNTVLHACQYNMPINIFLKQDPCFLQKVLKPFWNILNSKIEVQATEKLSLNDLVDSEKTPAQEKGRDRPQKPGKGREKLDIGQLLKESSKNITSAKPTREPTTSKKPTREPTTSKKPTREPATSGPTISKKPTLEPATSGPTISKKPTPELTISKKPTLERATSAKPTLEPATSAKPTPEPATSEPTPFSRRKRKRPLLLNPNAGR